MAYKTIKDVFYILRERKKFLRELSLTEINVNEHPYLYTEIMGKLLDEYDYKKFWRNELAPTFRIARTGRWYSCDSFVQNGRFISPVYIHHVNIFVSVDIKEFVRFLLLTEGVYLYNFRTVLLNFTLGLYNELLNRNIRAIKKDFLLAFCYSNEEIRVGVAHAISRYMELKTKKILRLKKPNSIINKYYGR